MRDKIISKLDEINDLVCVIKPANRYQVVGLKRISQVVMEIKVLLTQEADHEDN